MPFGARVVVDVPGAGGALLAVLPLVEGAGGTEALLFAPSPVLEVSELDDSALVRPLEGALAGSAGSSSRSEVRVATAATTEVAASAAASASAILFRRLNNGMDPPVDGRRARYPDALTWTCEKWSARVAPVTGRQLPFQCPHIPRGE